MDVILLERVEKLGQMGEVVRVRAGFARNFLLPRKKALRATQENLTYFETQRKELEARNLERRDEAATVAESLNGQTYVLLRQAGDSGQLYGSVTARDVADAATEAGIAVDKSQVVLDKPIKTIGMHTVRVVLHAEVSVTVSLNVARSADEAERQARGENVLANRGDEDDDALALAEELFESEEAAEGEAETETE